MSIPPVARYKMRERMEQKKREQFRNMLAGAVLLVMVALFLLFNIRYTSGGSSSMKPHPTGVQGLVENKALLRGAPANKHVWIPANAQPFVRAPCVGTTRLSLLVIIALSSCPFLLEPKFTSTESNTFDCRGGS
jgi:hypothetical protein